MEEIEALQAKAKALRAEASAMEIEMNELRTKQRKRKLSESDQLLETLFPQQWQSGLMFNESVRIANILRKDRWSPEQVLLVVDRIYEKQSIAAGRPSSLLSSSSSPTTSSAGEFQIGNTQNAALTFNETEFVLWNQALTTLLEAVVYVDEGTQFDNDGNIINVSTGDTGGENKVRDDIAISSENSAQEKPQQRENSRWNGRVEMAIKTRLRELRRDDEAKLKRLKMTAVARASAATATTPSANSTINSFVVQTMRRGMSNETTTTTTGSESTMMGGGITDINTTVFVQQITMIPMWVPSSFLPFLISSKRKSTSIISRAQVEKLQNDILFGSRFYVTSYDAVPIAVVFRGNVRTPNGLVNETDDRLQTALVFEEIQERLEKDDSDLSDQIQLFMMADPEWRPNQDEREPKPKPVLLALSKSVTPDLAAYAQNTLSDNTSKESAFRLLYNHNEAVWLQNIVKVSLSLISGILTSS